MVRQVAAAAAALGTRRAVPNAVELRHQVGLYRTVGLSLPSPRSHELALKLPYSCGACPIVQERGPRATQLTWLIGAITCMVARLHPNALSSACPAVRNRTAMAKENRTPHA